MARPIEETPVLTGEDARRFMQRMQENRKVSAEEYQRMMSTYERYEKIAEME